MFRFMTGFVDGESQTWKLDNINIIYDAYRTYSIGNTSFEINAIVEHYGSMQFGHYLVYVKIGAEWYKFNDYTIPECVAYDDMRMLSGKQVYAIYFRKLESRDSNGGTHPDAGPTSDVDSHPDGGPPSKGDSNPEAGPPSNGDSHPDASQLLDAGSPSDGDAKLSAGDTTLNNHPGTGQTHGNMLADTSSSPGDVTLSKSQKLRQRRKERRLSTRSDDPPWKKSTVDVVMSTDRGVFYKVPPTPGPPDTSVETPRKRRSHTTLDERQSKRNTNEILMSTNGGVSYDVPTTPVPSQEKPKYSKYAISLYSDDLARLKPREMLNDKNIDYICCIFQKWETLVDNKRMVRPTSSKGNYVCSTQLMHKLRTCNGSYDTVAR